MERPSFKSFRNRQSPLRSAELRPQEPTASISDPDLFFSRPGIEEQMERGFRFLTHGSVRAVTRKTQISGSVSFSGGEEYNVEAKTPYLELHFDPAGWAGSRNAIYSERPKPVEAKSREEAALIIWRGLLDFCELVKDPRIKLEEKFVVGAANYRFANIVVRQLGFSVVRNYHDGSLVIARGEELLERVTELVNRLLPVMEEKEARKMKRGRLNKGFLKNHPFK